MSDRIYKTPEGTYRVRYVVNGQRRGKTFKKKKDAEAFDREKQDRIHGYRPPEGLYTDKSDRTLAEFYAVFMERYAHKNTSKGRIAKLWAPKVKAPEIKHLERKWGDWTLAEINRPESIDEWHSQMRNAGCTKAAMWSAHDALMTLINQAHKWRWLMRVDIEGMAPDYAPHKRTFRPWLPSSIEAVRDYFLTRVASPPKGRRGGGVNGAMVEPYRWARLRDATVISVMGYMALRPGEAFDLRWEDLLDERGRIVSSVWINSHRPTHEDDSEEGTKTDEPRMVRVPPWVRADLTDFHSRSGFPREGYAFSKERGGDPLDFPGDLSNWTKGWREAVQAVGLEAKPPTHLRKSCVSTWIRSGMSNDMAARRAGHTPEVGRKHYIREIEMAELEDHESLDIPALVDAARSGRAWPENGLTVVGEA